MSQEISPKNVVSVIHDGGTLRGEEQHLVSYSSLSNEQNIHSVSLYYIPRSSLLQRKQQKLDNILKDVPEMVNYVMIYVCNF